MQTRRFFIMTTDPVHIGTGGMRLGRVDNTIVREPGTNLPKIPATALHGAIRNYAARRYGKPQCAGQKGHCGRPTCPICYTFGSTQGEGGSFSGVVSIGDARILLFPVYSMVGPVWVTSPAALFDAGFNMKDDKGAPKPFEVDKENKGTALWEFPSSKHLNLGWLMVGKENNLPDGLRDKLPIQIPEQIRNRIVLVSDKLFSQIVNSNLEVRTSVAINPETGAAEEGALFTYEAIPRATILWFEVVEDDFRGEFPSKGKLEKWKNTLDQKKDDAKEILKRWCLWKEEDGESKFDESVKRAKEWVENELNRHGNNGVSWEDPTQVVTAGLEWAEHLGIGGMGTRGFGRVRTLCSVEVCSGQLKESSYKSIESGEHENAEQGGRA